MNFYQSIQVRILTCPVQRPRRRREMSITYEEAKKAKEILLEYLFKYVDDYDEIDKNRTEKIVYFALTQDYFLN